MLRFQAGGGSCGGLRRLSAPFPWESEIWPFAEGAWRDTGLFPRERSNAEALSQRLGASVAAGTPGVSRISVRRGNDDRSAITPCSLCTSGGAGRLGSSSHLPGQLFFLGEREPGFSCGQCRLAGFSRAAHSAVPVPGLSRRTEICFCRSRCKI